MCTLCFQTSLEIFTSCVQFSWRCTVLCPSFPFNLYIRLSKYSCKLYNFSPNCSLLFYVDPKFCFNVVHCVSTFLKSVVCVPWTLCIVFQTSFDLCIVFPIFLSVVTVSFFLSKWSFTSLHCSQHLLQICTTLFPHFSNLYMLFPNISWDYTCCRQISPDYGFQMSPEHGAFCF